MHEPRVHSETLMVAFQSMSKTKDKSTTEGPRLRPDRAPLILVRPIFAVCLSLSPAPALAASLPTLFECTPKSAIELRADGTIGPTEFTEFFKRERGRYIVDTADGILRGLTPGKPSRWNILSSGGQFGDFVASNRSMNSPYTSYLRLRISQNPITFLLFDQSLSVIVVTGTCKSIA